MDTLYRIVDTAGQALECADAYATAPAAQDAAARLWAQGIEAYTLAAPAAVYALPPRFYHDHCARALPAGAILRETARLVYVLLDAPTFEEIESDAGYYCDGATAADMVYCDPTAVGLISSARATLRRLRAQGAPQSS